MMRWLVLFLFLVAAAQQTASQNDTSTATSCDTAAFHLTPQGSCKDCEDCPKECDPTDDHYAVFPTSDCDGMASSEGGGQDGGGDGQCDTTVYHVNPQGGCKVCGSNCPPECNPENDKYQVYTSADCDGNGSTEEGGGGGGDEEGGEEGTTTDQAGTPAESPTDPPKDDTSGAMQRDSMVAFMEVLIVSLPLLMLYWPFENQ